MTSITQTKPTAYNHYDLVTAFDYAPMETHNVDNQRVQFIQ